MTISKKAVVCGSGLSLAISSLTSLSAADCGDAALAEMTSVQSSYGMYMELLKDKKASDRETCYYMKTFLRDAERIFKKDYSSCLPNKKVAEAYAALLKETRSEYNDLKKDDFKAFHCDRYNN